MYYLDKWTNKRGNKYAHVTAKPCRAGFVPLEQDLVKSLELARTIAKRENRRLF